MKYLVMDAGYCVDKDANAIFGTNDKQEAILVARDFGSGTVVVRADGEEKEIVYIASYKEDLGLAE